MINVTVVRRDGYADAEVFAGIGARARATSWLAATVKHPDVVIAVWHDTMSDRTSTYLVHDGNMVQVTWQGGDPRQ